MKFQHQGQTNSDDAAFTELKTQRDAAIAEIARLREAHHTRESQLIQLQNENDVLKVQLSDAKRQIEQQNSQKARRSSAVVDLCTPEPEDPEERLGSGGHESKRVSLKRKHSDAVGPKYPAKKGEKLVCSLDIAGVANHLARFHPFQVQPTSQRPRVSRDFLAQIYGCSSKLLFAPITKGRFKDRPVVIQNPNWDLNPLVPAAPGLPGALFTLRKEYFDHPVWSLFVCATPKPSGWGYYGEYQFTVSGVLSKTEFMNQESTVKKAWGDRILKTKILAAYLEARARIYLRKSGTPITAGAVALESQRIKEGRGGEITSDDVINALSSGEESIPIVSMTCIDFDHGFADSIARKWNNFSPK
ncbi:hypothetical protein BJ138DRAFT_1164744 [Hygrophoropsis aurantiaca]|uniref:Uncharacterized protein n=1 Tax=Hygrophoropsis aurantiaca TaxID=72124 RepID=A0ACB7ZWJ3_9AGAM|nr:hypothetical protein BJ138DRAFT_1164744 [Hygrophoropsis aurantiaca]